MELEVSVLIHVNLKSFGGHDMELTFRQKVENWISDRKDEMDILRRKDFSWRFKLATILSNGQLRINTGSILYHLDKVSRYLENNRLTLWNF